jgi:NifU-like protein involved in Fe-S cluster formation
MASALYNQDILRLATSIPAAGRLVDPDGSADRRSPTCGSRVIVDVGLDEEGRLGELAVEVRACALGQASAALMSAHATGRSLKQLREAIASLRAYLAELDVETAGELWPGITVFAAARAYPARHASIMLAFEAVSEAMEQALDRRSCVKNAGAGE